MSLYPPFYFFFFELPLSRISSVLFSMVLHIEMMMVLIGVFHADTLSSAE